MPMLFAALSKHTQIYDALQCCNKYTSHAAAVTVNRMAFLSPRVLEGAQLQIWFGEV